MGATKTATEIKASLSHEFSVLLFRGVPCFHRAPQEPVNHDTWTMPPVQRTFLSASDLVPPNLKFARMFFKLQVSGFPPA